MTDFLTSLVIWLLLFGPIIVFFGYIIIKDIKSLVDDYKPETVAVTVAPVAVYDENEYYAFDLVKNAYESLKNQHACGYGPWLSSIIDRSIQYEIVHDERGRVSVGYTGTCPPNVALAAMFKTRKELLRSRFDLTEVNRAIVQLMRM